MPATRYASRRRRSSLAHLHLKAAKYRAPKNVTFAQNVTPASFEKTRTEVKTEDGVLEEETKHMLFPPCKSPRGPPKKKQPKDRRRSQGYIPRPPNAFMLFRADFVKQKHVPGTIEPDHTNLSKIIGLTWKTLPEEEKQVWQDLALKEAAEHRRKYPNYKYQPRQGAGKKRKPKIEQMTGEEDKEEQERLHEDVRQLLLEGLKGEELEQAIAELRRERSVAGTPSTRSYSTAPTPAPSLPPASSEGLSSYMDSMYDPDGVQLAPAPTFIRRPSSVPLPGVYSFPTGLPPLPFQRMSSIDFGGPHMIPPQLPRRPSSAQAAMFRTWDAPFDMPPPFDMHAPFGIPPFDRTFSPVAEGAALDQTNMFEETYTDGSAFPGAVSWTFDAPPLTPGGNHFMPPQEIEISPLDVVPQHASAPAPVPTHPQAQAPEWMDHAMPMVEPTYSDYSTPDEILVTPSDPMVPLFAPRPQRPFDTQDAHVWDAGKVGPAPAHGGPVGEPAHDNGGDPFSAYIDFGAYPSNAVATGSYAPNVSAHGSYAPNAPAPGAYPPAPDAYTCNGAYGTNTAVFPPPVYAAPHPAFG